jgi:hypothetical protein
MEFRWLIARNLVARGCPTNLRDASSVHCSVILCRQLARHREGDDFVSARRGKIRWATHRLRCLTPALVVRVVYINS